MQMKSARSGLSSLATTAMILAIPLALIVACAKPPVARGERLPPTLMEYTQVHTRLRDALRMKEGEKLQSCGEIVFIGPVFTDKGKARGELADGPASYYDNRTGRRIASCDFWTCASDNEYCDRSCPPRKWTCTFYVP